MYIHKSLYWEIILFVTQKWSYIKGGLSKGTEPNIKIDKSFYAQSTLNGLTVLCRVLLETLSTCVCVWKGIHFHDCNVEWKQFFYCLSLNFTHNFKPFPKFQKGDTVYSKSKILGIFSCYIVCFKYWHDGYKHV